ncbi:hypothetical protein BH23ACT6_BH23ACT6_16380 [soil metagenome]
MQVRRADPEGKRSSADIADHAGQFFGSFALTGEERLEAIVAAFDDAKQAFIADVRATDPAGEVMAPPEPWAGRHEPTPTHQRFHLMHLIEEFARHAGHADIIREQLDGATAMALTFGVEGREGNDFITPWKPERRPRSPR